MSYSVLKADIADYFHRTDLTAKIPAWIALAEAVFIRELSIKDLDVFEAGTTAAGYIDLPYDFGSLTRITITYGGRERALDYMAQSDVSTEITDAPGYYSFENGGIRVWGAGTGSAYTLYYKAELKPLSTSNSSNWVLLKAPDLYLYASCLEGAKYLRNDREIQSLAPVVSAALDSLRRYIERRGMPSSASMRIKPRH